MRILVSDSYAIKTKTDSQLITSGAKSADTINMILAVEPEVKIYEQQAAEWEKIHIYSRRVGTMAEAITILRLGDIYLFVSINGNTIPAFQFLLPAMRGSTESLIFANSNTFTAEQRAAVLRDGADEYDRLSESPKTNIDVACEYIKKYRRRDKKFANRLPVLIEGVVVVSPERRLAWVNNFPVDLTKTEFDILVLLLRNHGIVLTYDQILEHIWHFGYDGGGHRYVWKRVHSLRQKLEKAAGVDGLITTVKDVGYKFCAT